MEKRALIVASVASHIKQFCDGDIQNLISLGYHVDVAANFNCGNAIDSAEIEVFQQSLKQIEVGQFQVDFVRSFSNLSGHIKAFRQLSSILKHNSYDIVHCHTPIAGSLCRFAAKKYRRKGMIVLYTAHGFHFFKGAPFKNWVLFYPVEKICSKWTDVLITINQEDFAFAKAKMDAYRIEHIPGVGIDLEKFYPNKFPQTIIQQTREGLGLSDNDEMLLSVGELTKRKNHILVIRALAALNNPQLFYFICGCGELEAQLKKQAEQLGISNRVFLLGYRPDVDLLFSCADLFVFPSFQEGLPVALMEAIATGVPSIASNVRGNNELLSHSALFDPTDAASLAKMIGLWAFRNNDDSINDNLCNIGGYRKTVVMDKMKGIYSTLFV